MALYFYQALSKEGKKISGYLDSTSSQSVKEQLVKQGMYPIIIEQADSARQVWWRRIFFRAISRKEKILFTKQLAVLLRSGVPLLQSLELLGDQFEGNLRSMLITIKDDVKQGTSFADALQKYPQSFEPIYVQLVRAGEASGKLELILERLVQYLERQEEMRSRVRAALSYPLMQLSVAVLVVAAMLYWVVPTMAENFVKQQKELPGPTQLLLAISNFVTTYYLLIIIFGVLAYSGFRYWSSTKAGARILDTIKLRIPLIKYFVRMRAVVQFSQTLGMLLESGVNLAQALDIVVKIIDNQLLADTLNQARDKIIKQGKIAQYLKQTGIFPPIATYLIRTGEETGHLDAMLLTVGNNYEKELAELADSLSAKIGPLLLIVMAVIVGFIVLAISLPMVQMGDTYEI
jgi:type II secretory pathway component PulF